MSVNELLGWCRSLLDSLGLTNVIIVGAIIVSAIAIYKRFFGSD